MNPEINFSLIGVYPLPLAEGTPLTRLTEGQAYINYNFSYIREILCMQNRFRCTPMLVGNCACKRADVHIENKNLFTFTIRL